MHTKIALGVALCVFASGCTTVLYDGPRRPSGEVAQIVVERGAALVNVDARPVRGGGAFVYEVLPGPHQVSAAPGDIETREPQVRQASLGGASACFEAKAASVYMVVQDRSPRLQVVDRESGESVESACVAGSAGQPMPARRAQPVERAPGHKSLVAAHDGLPMHPWGGFRLGVGYSSGGADLLNGDGGEPLPAGAGLHVSLGGTLIPVWIGNVGLGVGGSYGLKHNSANGGIGLSRSPAELWLEMLVRVSPRSFVEFAGGTHKDVNISLGSVSSDAWESSWGRVFDLGLYTVSSKHVAWGFGIHHVGLRYKSYGMTYDAGGTGFEVRLYINP